MLKTPQVPSEQSFNEVSFGKVEIRRGISHDQIDSLVNIVFAFSEDIGMEFGIKKFVILVLKRGKVNKVKSIGLNFPDEKLM